MNQRLLITLKLRRVWLILLTVWFSAGLSPAFADVLQEYTAKSLLALNLARFTEWPVEVFKSNATINLCVLGDDLVQEAFSLLDKKRLGDKTLTVYKIRDAKQLNGCQVLFVSAETDKIAQLVEISQKQHILTIGEADDFLKQGGIVYLEIKDEKINLNVNVTAAKKTGIRIDARVLRLATIFNP